MFPTFMNMHIHGHSKDINIQQGFNFFCVNIPIKRIICSHPVYLVVLMKVMKSIIKYLYLLGAIQYNVSVLIIILLSLIISIKELLQRSRSTLYGSSVNPDQILNTLITRKYVNEIKLLLKMKT